MVQSDGIVFLEINDLILTPVYLFYILIFAYLIRNIQLHHSPMRKYFIPGLMVKIFGGLGVLWVYGFYYKSGDTFYYFYDSRTFNASLKEGWGLFFKLLFLPANKITTSTYESTVW